MNAHSIQLPKVEQVAQAFSQAAAKYDQVADLQRLVADDLMTQGKSLYAGKILDIGCGTGYVSAHIAQQSAVDSVLGLDVAQGMIDFSKERHTNAKLSWVLGDAQQLPQVLAAQNGSFNTVVSSLAIQWCSDLDALFSGIAQSLTTGGVFQCATLGPRTLHELKWAWAQVDDYQHVNDFVAIEPLREALKGHFKDVEITSKDVVLNYDKVQKLTRDLKDLGASNHNGQAAKGLTGMGRLRQMVHAYESLRDETGKLPVTYQALYITGKKP